ncbi:hypothetical protein [Galbibacter pacificus]|uniref:Uncharacterized protein n=1 Tax=Galbibacter pacificus TaxID=2996052 RepID=A0ABT6FQF1_9FLAO|nr:hypothetical protein [Galbibacter pacificus]MDG3582034.1 hypothetical protein [Galbibacter pacificus]MDG3585492.1 hypothetical protein [Galbibacter pacificus]
MKRNSDFRYDLKIGQEAEDKVAAFLKMDKSEIEVKYEKRTCITSNIFLEFEGRGKPSGVATSEAKYYVFEFGNEWEGMKLVMPTKKLKEMARNFYKRDGYRVGGDSNTSKGVLIPVHELLNPDSELTMPEKFWEKNTAQLAEEWGEGCFSAPSETKKNEPEEPKMTLEYFLQGIDDENN